MKKAGYVRSILVCAVSIYLSVVLAACGGGGGDDTPAGTSGSITLQYKDASGSLSDTFPAIPADNTSSLIIHAQITDSAGNPVRHYTSVTFSTTLGRFRNGSTTYTIQTQPPLDDRGWPDIEADPLGIAEAQLIAGTTPGVAKVTVRSNNVTQTVYITLSGQSAAIKLAADPVTIPADGISSSTITATLTNSSGTPVTPGTEVTFTTTLGTFANTTQNNITPGALSNRSQTLTVKTPDATGVVAVSLISATTAGSALVTATSNNVTQAIYVGFGGEPVSIKLAADPVTIPADGKSSSTISATLTDAIGAAVTPGTSVTFTTTLGSFLNGSTTYTVETPDSSGKVSVSLISATGVGSALVTAESNSVTQAIYVGFGGAPVAISLSANPTRIWADGKSSSAIQAALTDGTGKAVTPGTSVTFTTDLGTFSNGSQTYTVTTPDSTGIVTVSLIAGTKLGSALVSATSNSVTQSVYVIFTDKGGDPFSIALAANPTSIPADGTSTSTITATLKDSLGNPVNPGTSVTFSTTLGTFSNGTKVYTVTTPDATGVVSVSLIAGTTGGSATVTATSNGVSQTVYVTFGGATGSIALAANPSSIPADGSSSSTITATLKDSAGAPVTPGTSVTFTTTLGSFSNGGTTYTLTTPDTTGIVSVSLIAGTTAGSATVTATSNGVKQSVTVTFTGAVVASITVTATPSTLTADGTSTSEVRAEVKDAQGNPIADGEKITFTITSGTGSLSASSVTTSGGYASVTYTAGTTAGSVVIRAMSSNNVSGTVTITLEGAGVGSITVTADPTEITADGSSSSAITATLLDTTGKPVSKGTSVTFTTTLGTFSNGSTTYTVATPDDTGVVVASLIAGTTAGTAKVTVTSGGVSQPVDVIFKEGGAGGGAPYGEHLGLNPTTLNIAGLVYYGLEDTMTMRVTDMNFNNVPDGTPVSFTTDYGGITPSATTQSDSKGSYATATLTSEVPDPPDGFVTPTTTMTGGTDARVLCMAINPLDNDIIYLGTDGGGIFKTIDGGTNWSQVGVRSKGLTNGMVWDIEIDSSNTAILYAGTADGIFRSTGSGDEWERMDRAKEITGESLGNLNTTDLNEDGYSDTTYTLTYSSNMIRAKTYVYLNNVRTNEYVYTSANTIKFIIKDLTNGQAITIDYTTPVMIPPYYPIRAIAIETTAIGTPLTTRTLYAGTYGTGVYKSTDSGFSWAATNSGLSDQDVLSLGIDPTTNATLYAGTQGGGVFKSTNSAGTWAPSNTGLPASVINTIAIDPNTPANIYIGSLQNGVYYSTTSGAAWIAPTTNVTSLRVNKIVLDSSGGVTATEIYAGTFGDGTDPLGGVYKSADSGATWSRLTALTDNHVLSLGIIGGATDTLFAGTWGRNFFKSADGGTTWTAMNGTSPNALTNQIFATARVLFSDNTASVVPVQTATSNQGAGGLEYANTTNRDYIYAGGTATFFFTVNDSIGNPLVSGSTISASVTSGSLSGDTSLSIPDRLTHAEAYYAVIWTNNLGTDVTENASGVLTISVTSDNGNTSTSVTRTLVKPVTVSISPSAPTFGVTVTVTPSGGSETTNGGVPAAISGYTIVHRQGTVYCNYGSSVVYTSGGTGTTDTVLVTDNVTGGTATLSYTLP